MIKIKIKELLNVNLINKVIFDFYQITNIPITVVDSSGEYIFSNGWTTMCSCMNCEYDMIQSYCLQEYWKNNLFEHNITEISCLHGLKMNRLPVYINEAVVANIFLKIPNQSNDQIEFSTKYLKFMESIANCLGDFLTKTLVKSEREEAIINNYEELKVSYDKLLSVNSEFRFKLWELENISQQKKKLEYNEVNKEQKQYIMETVTALTSMIEAKDSLTARHQRKVAYIALKIAKKLKLNREQCESIYVAAILHDIGKVGIPSEVLGKADQLTKLEYEMVKGHVQIGYNILKGIHFPWPIADIVLQHHEKINGSGYPNSLIGDAICIESKIIAIADTIEAITAHRSYKASLSMAYALEEINKYAGIYYDQKIVEACLEIYR